MTEAEMTGKASAHLLRSQNLQGHLFDRSALTPPGKSDQTPQLAALESRAVLIKMAKKQLAKKRIWLSDKSNQLKIRTRQSLYQRLTTSLSPRAMLGLLGETGGHHLQRRT